VHPLVLELRSVSHPGRNQSLYQLSYLVSHLGELLASDINESHSCLPLDRSKQAPLRCLDSWSMKANPIPDPAGGQGITFN
jgi:hypothetical protein